MLDFDDVYKHDVINNSGEEVPAHSVMQLDTASATDASGRRFVGVVKPDGDGRVFFANGPNAIADGAKFKAALLGSVPLWIAYAGGDPSPGDELGPVDDSWGLSSNGSGAHVVDVNSNYSLAYVSSSPQGTCPLVHEFWIDGNPSSGSQDWEYTIDGDTQDVTLDYNDTAANVKSAFLAALTGLATDDLEVSGGPFPNVAVYVTFDSTLEVEWPPVQGTTTLNNGAAIKIRQSGG